MNRAWVPVVAALVPGLAAALAGCGPPPPPPPAVLTLQIEAGPDQNPNKAGQPAPVAFHLMQLTSTDKFERADVFALLEKEAATLGDEAAASETLVLAPGESKTLVRTMKPGVQSLGVAVAFRDIDQAAWRVMAPVAPSGLTALTLQTHGTTARLQPGKTP